MQSAQESEEHPSVVPLSQLVDYSVSLSYRHITHLVNTLPGKEESHRRAQLVGFIFYSRQLLLRLKAIVSWEKERRQLLQEWHQHGRALGTPTRAMVDSADHLFYLYSGELSMARLPLYDVPSAMAVLRHGDYPLLPSCIRENLQDPPALSPKAEQDVREQLDSRIRAQLLFRPIGGVLIHIEKGCLHLKVPGEFRAILTLGCQESLEIWRLLSVEIYVNSHSGDTVHHPRRITALQSELQQFMADSSSNPLQCLLDVLHDGCLDLAMSILNKQAKNMRDGGWKGIIQVDTQSNVLRISYWKKEEGSAETLTITKRDTEILVSHEPRILDPATNGPAQFSINMESIDLEQMLQQCLQYNAYTRLKTEFETYRQQKTGHRLDNNEVTLRREGETYSLNVRAYCKVFFNVSVSPRNGEWVVRAPDYNAKQLRFSLLIEKQLISGSDPFLAKFRNLRAQMLRLRIESIAQGFGLYPVNKTSKTFPIPKEWARPNNSSSVWFTFRDFPHSALYVYIDDQKLLMQFLLLFGHSSSGEEGSHPPDKRKFIQLKPEESVDQRLREANVGNEPERAYLVAMKNILQQCRQQIVCHRIAEQLQRPMVSGIRAIPVGSQANSVESFSVTFENLETSHNDINVILLVRAGVENSVVALYESPYYADLFHAHLAANERRGRRSQNRIVGPVESHIFLTSSGLEMQYHALDSQLLQSIRQDLRKIQWISGLVSSCHACIEKENEKYKSQNPNNTHPLFVLRPESVWPARFHFVFNAHIYSPNSGVRGPVKVHIDISSMTTALRVKCIPDIGADTFLSQQAMCGSVESLLLSVKYLFDTNQAVLTAATEILSSAKYPEAIEIAHHKVYHSRIVLGGYEGVVSLDIYSTRENAVITTVSSFPGRKSPYIRQNQHLDLLKDKLMTRFSNYIKTGHISRYLVIPKENLKSFLVECHKIVVANAYSSGQSTVPNASNVRSPTTERGWPQNNNLDTTPEETVVTYDPVRQENKGAIYLDQ